MKSEQVRGLPSAVPVESIAARARPRPTDPTKALKRSRRKAAWAARRSQARSQAERAALADAVARHGIALVRSLAIPPARVCTYESWSVEPPTDVLNAQLAAAGYELLVPVTLPDLDLDWRRLGDPDGPTARLGPAALAAVEVVLAPGTLVDLSGTRLGQGGGCYDRSIPRLRPGTPVVTVLFDDELTEEPLPRAGHDAAVDAVLQPSGVTWLRRR